MHRLARTYCFLLYLLLLAPHLYLALGTSKKNKLGGVESTAAPLDLSFQAFWDGHLAGEVDALFSRTMGFRSELIRTDNQINFSVFGEISAQTSSPIVLGKHETLFEKSYIDALNNRNRVPDEQLVAIARDLAELQHLLRDRNIALVLLVSPNKAVYHESEVPRLLLRDNREATTRNWETLRPYLQKSGVTFIDTPALFKERRPSEYPLFAKGGTHWSYFGACIITSALTKMVESIAGERMRQVSCNNLTFSTTPRLTDKDLAELANLWSISPFYEKLAYPAAIASENISAKKPRIVFVGSSYLWTILHYLRKFHITKDYKMLYYYKTMHRQRGAKQPIIRDSLNWDGLLDSVDAVVIEANEAAIEGVGYGFIQDAIKTLRTN